MTLDLLQITMFMTFVGILAFVGDILIRPAEDRQRDHHSDHEMPAPASLTRQSHRARAARHASNHQTAS